MALVIYLVLCALCIACFYNWKGVLAEHASVPAGLTCCADSCADTDILRAAACVAACSGAGNFRRMAGPPVYGVAMCTVHGIRNVLRAVADAQLRDTPKVC